MTDFPSFIPVYDFSPTLNAGYLKQILPLMVRHSVAANPINYAIWYDYVGGGNPQLSAAVDSLIKERKAFDCDASIEIYKRHICNASAESFEKINLQLQKVINQAAAAIGDTCHKAEESNDRFQKKTVLLETLPDATVIQVVLQEVIEETKSLAATSLAMQSKLNKAHQEMEQLRSELSEVRKLAVTDGLTGLLNRRAFDQRLSEIVEQSETGECFCLTMLDIDHFKRVNDTYGHNVGDNVIKYVAALIKKHAQQHHHVARYGGEELAIIMPRTSVEKAIEISETIRRSMESSRLKRKDNNQPLGTITVSVGVAKLQKGDGTESFIVRADQALYKAKQTGRNRVIHLAVDAR